MAQNWVALVGNVLVREDEFELVPTVAFDGQASPSAGTPPPHGLVKSNIKFEKGTVEWDVMLSDPASSCAIGLNSAQGAFVFAGLNIHGIPYSFASFKNGQWEPIATSGLGSQIEPHRWHRMRLEARGSNLELLFNDVSVVSASYTVMRGPITFLLQGTGTVTVKGLAVKATQPICFVVMQFTAEYDALFSDVIRPTCEAFDYRVVRADDFYHSGLIIEDITRSIREAAVVIADITPNNPNVYYEVGFAHGISKPTILLSDRKREKLPFDISGFRTLFYDNTIGGKTEVERGLRKHLEAITNR